MAQPEQMPPPAEAGQPDQGGGGATKLVVQINQMLGQLGQMLDQAGVLDSDGAQEYAGIISSYQDFVERELGGQQGPKQEPAEPGNVPMETAGKKAVPVM